MADLTIRDWMVIIGALLILAVLADAWRRIYQDRRAPVRMKLSEAGEESPGEQRSERDVDLAWLKELPNGGARVVDRGPDFEDDYEDDDVQDVVAPRASTSEPAAARPVAAEERAAPPGSASAESETSPPAPEHKEAAPQVAARDTGKASATGAAPAPHAKPATGGQAQPQTAARKAPPPQRDDDVELFSGMSSSDEPENLDWLDALEAEQRPEPQVSAARAQLPRDIDPEVFMLNVVARDPRGFRGDDIMQILLACGLRFGDMSFFHRHEHDTGRGPIQFSVANMLQPGVFDIDNMADFTTQGLVFFVTLPGPDDMMKAYDYMLETAQAVARNLKGDVLDETRSVLTRQTLEHARQQIRDLERRLLAKAR